MSFSVKDVLRIEVAPALGCTEPVAIALGAAAAAQLLNQKKIDQIDVWVDPNIYKNGLAVIIPGTEGLNGLDLAAALGAFGGDPGLKLEVLESIDDEIVRKSRDFIKSGKVKVHLLNDHAGLYIRTLIKSGAETAESVISIMHDNIVSLSLNGNQVEESPLLSKTLQGGKSDLEALEDWLRKLALQDLVRMVDDLDEDDLAFIEEGVTYNLRLADYGLKYGPGLGIGKALERLVRQKILKKDMVLAARMLTCAASDARMGGVKLPAMSSGGSGNHGLTAILPIWAIQDYIACEKKDVLNAIGLSHLVTGYIKSFTGRLSAVCGCSVAAGAGATAGVVYLLGGDIHHIAGAIKNLTQDLAGVICDGAKAGCSLKLATAAGTSVQAALFSLQGINVVHGIVDASPEQTMQNIGKLSTKGMIETDRTILQIMLDKQFSDY